MRCLGVHQNYRYASPCKRSFLFWLFILAPQISLGNLCLFGCQMFQTSLQHSLSAVCLSAGKAQQVYLRFCRSVLQVEIRGQKNTTKVVGQYTKTVSCEMLKCSAELRGTGFDYKQPSSDTSMCFIVSIKSLKKHMRFLSLAMCFKHLQK